MEKYFDFTEEEFDCVMAQLAKYSDGEVLNMLPSCVSLRNEDHYQRYDVGLSRTDNKGWVVTLYSEEESPISLLGGYEMLYTPRAAVEAFLTWWQYHCHNKTFEESVCTTERKTRDRSIHIFEPIV